MVADADFAAGRFLPFVIELIADSHDCNAEHADDHIEGVMAHDAIALHFRGLALGKFMSAGHARVEERPAFPAFEFACA
jgi:hypothetical protein